MNPTPRGVKRPRIPEDDAALDPAFTHGPSEHPEIKGEFASPRSDVTGYSHPTGHTPGSTAPTPDNTFAIPPIPHGSQYPFPSSSPQAQSHHVYPPPPTPLSHNTRPPQLVSNDGRLQVPEQGALPSRTQDSAAKNASNSAFRNVSACNRCRLRKNRCDQRLPACRACEKAGVKCVGFDPFLGREIPRSYVYYLESRTTYLENLLRERGIEFLSAESFALEKRPDDEQSAVGEVGQPGAKARIGSGATSEGVQSADQQKPVSQESRKLDTEEKKLNNLVSNIGMVYVQGASDPRYLGSTSGISFARVVFAAVKSTMSRASSDRGGARSRTGSGTAAGSASLRDSAFGLQTKPTFKQAPFPERGLGLKLVNLFFEHANPQLPILHRGEFMTMFERVYAQADQKKTPREAYLLNIVFAIGAGIILNGPTKESHTASGQDDESNGTAGAPSKKSRFSSKQAQPEEYHASAIIHLESFLGSAGSSAEPGDGSSSLEELQAVLLLAGFALLRPVAPGLWYIVGVAMRLAVDLGLHHEDSPEPTSIVSNAGSGIGVEAPPSTADTFRNGSSSENADVKDTGRRQWIRDLRRRLWWCVYSVDRLVSTCVGRPFGVTDQVVTTEFPSLLDDKYISAAGFIDGPEQSNAPSAKLVAHHYFRLRLLQSEIVQVLQHQNAQRTHAARPTPANEFMYTKLPSPFMRNFTSFRQWRTDIDRRLWEWKETAPSQQEAGVEFSPLFFELNYWQAVITLYQNNLAAPAALAHEITSLDDGIGSPSPGLQDEQGDEEFVYLKVAEAGQKVLKLYRQLHRIHLVNYTYLATHHLFMAGISFLYAIWHSTAVRSHLSLDDVDFTVLAATSVLTDLTEKCPPAEACKEAFDRLSRMCIQLCMSTTGFGPQVIQSARKSVKLAPGRRPHTSKRPGSLPRMPSRPTFSGDTEVTHGASGRQPPKLSPRFDMSLKELFSDDETQSQMLQRPSNSAPGYWFTQQGQQQLQNLNSDAQGYQSTNNAYGPGMNQQQDYSQSDPNLAIDPLLQQVSPQSQGSQLPGQQQQQFASLPQQMQSDTYPIMTHFDASLFDTFQMANDDFMEGDTTMDLFGVGGADGGVDLFNGFFFGNGGAGQSLPTSGFNPI